LSTRVDDQASTFQLHKRQTIRKAGIGFYQFGVARVSCA
jgi:hypothetical protein